MEGGCENNHIIYGHILKCNSSPSMFNCGGCGVEGHGSSYQCIYCPFRTHEHCAYYYHYKHANPHENIEGKNTLKAVEPNDKRSEGLEISATKLGSKGLDDDGDSSEGFLLSDEDSSSDEDDSSDSAQGLSSVNGIIKDKSPPKSKQIMIDKIEMELSNIVGLDRLKKKLLIWAKGMLVDSQRRHVGMAIGSRRRPHFAFLGNPGTGKTTIARMMGTILHEMGILSTQKVIEVQRTDLVDAYVGGTGPKTKEMINKAMGGILFIDEAYRLVKRSSKSDDYGKEALDEVMSVMERRDLSIIFAGYTKPMERVFRSNEGLRRRINTVFTFDNYTCEELAMILQRKLTQEGHEFNDYKLEASCSTDVIAALIKKMTSEEVRAKMNAGLVDHILRLARDYVDERVAVDSTDRNLLATFSMQDLEAALAEVNEGEQSSLGNY